MRDELFEFVCFKDKEVRYICANGSIPFLNFTNVSITEKKIKILFFGALSHRRRKILEELQKNLSFHITVITGHQQVYGVKLYNIINNDLTQRVWLRPDLRPSA